MNVLKPLSALYTAEARAGDFDAAGSTLTQVSLYSFVLEEKYIQRVSLDIEMQEFLNNSVSKVNNHSLDMHYSAQPHQMCLYTTTNPHLCVILQT